MRPERNCVNTDVWKQHPHPLSNIVPVFSGSLSSAYRPLHRNKKNSFHSQGCSATKWIPLFLLLHETFRTFPDWQRVISGFAKPRRELIAQDDVDLCFPSSHLSPPSLFLLLLSGCLKTSRKVSRFTFQRMLCCKMDSSSPSPSSLCSRFPPSIRTGLLFIFLQQHVKPGLAGRDRNSDIPVC